MQLWIQEAKRSTWTFTWCVFSGTFQFVSFDYMSNQNNFWGNWNKNGWMWPCQAKEREEKNTHQLWHENCSLSVCIIVVNDKHSFFIWAKWKHVKVGFFFLPSRWLCLFFFFFIIRLFLFFWMCLVILYIQYVHAGTDVYVVQNFLYLTLECMYCTYIYFPHMFIIKNKKKRKLKTVRDL